MLTKINGHSELVLRARFFRRQLYRRRLTFLERPGLKTPLRRIPENPIMGGSEFGHPVSMRQVRTPRPGAPRCLAIMADLWNC